MTQLSIDPGFLDTDREVPAIIRRDSSRLSAAYPHHYLWVLSLAVLDVAVTALVLGTGGHELNILARWAIEQAGVAGLVVIKATTLALVIVICEYLGRHRPRAGLRIVEFAVIANSAAVACGLVYLTQFTLVLLQWI